MNKEDKIDAIYDMLTELCDKLGIGPKAERSVIDIKAEIRDKVLKMKKKPKR